MASSGGVLQRLVEWIAPKAARASEADLGDVGFEELGPFEPPAGFEFEPELCTRPPRPVPEELRRREAVRLRQQASVCGLIGALLLAASPLPLTHHWALFVPVLGYLSWIALALLGVSVWLQVRSAYAKVANRQYFEFGMPEVVRIRRIWLQPATLQHGGVLTYQFCAIVDYLSGDDGELRRHYLASAEFPATKKDRVETTYRTGDYATALRLPADDLNLYGFLGLKPGLGVVDRDEAVRRSMRDCVLITIGVLAVVGLIGWGFYSLDRFEPLDVMTLGDRLWVLGIGSTLGLPTSIAIALRVMRGERRKVGQRNALAAETGEAIELAMEDLDPARRTTRHKGAVLIAAAMLGLLFTNLASVGSFYALNALLDDGPAKLEPVAITDMIATDHKVEGLTMFRNFAIEFRFANDREKHKFTSTPQEMDQFHNAVGVASVRQGYFSLRWVEALTP
jgi:hypothetical protein